MTTSANPKFRHKTPPRLHAILKSNKEVAKKWSSLTPLARNEWICWITMPKLQNTRDEHLQRLQQELLAGKKRPCCWPGCPHRRATSAKYVS